MAHSSLQGKYVHETRNVPCTHHLLLQWLDDQDIQFLNENHLLVVKRSQGLPVLNLYNVTQVTNVTVEREYELPEAWSDAIIGFCPNTAPVSDLTSSSNALFYPDPSTRVLLITAKPNCPPTAPVPQQWLLINESYFRPTSRKDRLRAPWSTWGQYCLIRDIAPSPIPVEGPYAVGTRVVYLESMPPHSSSRSSGHAPAPGCPSRLNVIDFAPYPDESCRSSRAWSMIGQKSMLVPNETSREISASTVDGLSVKGIRVTEDNIVLFQVGFFSILYFVAKY